MVDFLLDLWRFMRMRKKYWLIPIILTLLLVGGLLSFVESTVLAPFIYTLF